MPRKGAPRPSSRAKVLAQWRGIDMEPLEKMRGRVAKRASDAMPAVLKELRMDRRRSEAEIVKVWNHLIDPTVTTHAQPTGIRNGTLFVSVDSSVWLSEIVRYRRKEILDRLQHSFGRELVTRISFRVGC
jgi:hypothetical protein